MLDFARLAIAHHLPIAHPGQHHHVAGDGWIGTHCPSCSPKEGYRLGFSTRSGAFHCWRCGRMKFWTAMGLLLKTNDIDKLKSIVAGFMDGPKQRDKIKPITRKRQLAPPPGAKPLLEQHRKYLIGRGFDPDELESEWDILGTDELGGKWAWRVVIPIADHSGRVCAYQGRSIGDAHPKYRMTPDADCLADPKSLIYGLDRMRSDNVIIVEGVTGVWRMGMGTVGLLGIDWNLKQMNQLRKFQRRVIMFDPGVDAQKRAKQLAEYLSLFGGRTEIVSGLSRQPGEFSAARVREIRRKIGV